MMDATSSNGSFFSPSAVLQVNCPSRQLKLHWGLSMLTMWYDIRPVLGMRTSQFHAVYVAQASRLRVHRASRPVNPLVIAQDRRKNRAWRHLRHFLNGP